MRKTDKVVKNQRRVPKQQRAIAKYNGVLDACTQVLAERGYQKATIMELSLVSDVPVASIYQYFPDKESIFIAWFERNLDQIYAFLLASLADQNTRDVQSLIHNMIKLALDSTSLNREGTRNLLVDLPHMLLSHMLSTTEQKTVETVMAISIDYLGQTPDDSLDRKLRILTRCLIGFMLQYVMDEHEWLDNDQISEELTALTVPYLQAALLD